MMMLLFKVNGDRYGVDVTDVVEVVPCVPLQKLPKSPANIAGLLNYRGSVIPVINGSILIGGQGVRPCLSSRIIMLRLENIRFSCIGLLAESVTETIRIDDDRFTATGLTDGGVSLVDKIVLDDGGMIQHINLKELIPNDVKNFMKEIKSGEVMSGGILNGS